MADEDKRERPIVLIVDDDIVMLRTMVNVLKEDFSTRIAKSGVQALKVITKEKPDLILLDYMMPVADGLQTLRMIRNERDMADVPVFFLTGVADSDMVGKAMTMKIEGYILKTMPPAEILSRIKNWFNGHSADK